MSADESEESFGSPEQNDDFRMNGTEFQAAYGENLEDILDLDTWPLGEAVADVYVRLQNEVKSALGQEHRIHRRIREDLYPVVFDLPNAPQNAGCYQATPEQVARLYTGQLFNGAVEACDGISLTHDSLPLAVTQLGVVLTSYNGNQGTWVQQLYRRDLRMSGPDPIEEIMNLLYQRQLRNDATMQGQRDRLTSLARHGILYYAERAILLHKSQAQWRMGHGVPIPQELLAGGGLVVRTGEGDNIIHDRPLLRHGLQVLRALLLDNQRWVFVSEELKDRVLLTFAEALHPLEYAIVGTLRPVLRRIITSTLPRRMTLQNELLQFVEDASEQIVVGVYRASRFAPPCIFYAHRDTAHQAALLALADSTLQEHRGFPMLLDLAKMVCKNTLGPEAFHATIQQAYFDNGMPYRRSNS